MAMDTQTGRVLAMQGGFSYQSSVFNRATQALRQPGSSFKPFVYAAALDSGYSPATIVVDAPIEVATGGRHLAAGERQREVLRADADPHRARAVAQPDDGAHRPGRRHGHRRASTPSASASTTTCRSCSSYSLGAGETTLYKMVAAYAMFANGGLRVEPTLVDRVQDRYGKTIYRHDQRGLRGLHRRRSRRRAASRWCTPTPTAIMDAITAYQITSMLQGAVSRGTSASERRPAAT